jgi:hypothetical protein
MTRVIAPSQQQNQSTVVSPEQQAVIDEFQRRRRLCIPLFIVPPLSLMLVRVVQWEWHLNKLLGVPTAIVLIVIASAWIACWIFVFGQYRCPVCNSFPRSNIVDSFGLPSRRIAGYPSYCVECGAKLSNDSRARF